MSERYTKLFSLPENLYAEGAPVIFSAGNLLKDNQTGKVLAQLKIKNVAAKPLKAATVLIHPQDAAGKPMAGDTQQKYLDLTAKTGEEFGQKTAVFLPDASARGFSIEVTQAVFSDNSTWEGTDAAWEQLPAPESLSSKLGDAELLKQYKLQFGGACETVPQENKDLWLCACGAWNRGEKCCACGKEKSTLFSLDLDALRADKDARLATEEAEREAKEAADKAAAEAKAKKTKKILAIAIPALAAALALFLLLTEVVIPNSRYNKAVALLDAGQYEDALAVLRQIKDYKDSRQLILLADHGIQERERLENEARIEEKNKIAYEEAEAFLTAEDYDEAIIAFQKLGDYRDSREKKNLAAYKKASQLFEIGEYKEAYLVFLSLGDYSDCPDRADNCASLLLDPYEKHVGTYKCEEGYTISISSISVSSAGEIRVIGTNTSYSSGHQDFDALLDESKNMLSYTLGRPGENGETHLYFHDGFIQQNWYNYKEKKEYENYRYNYCG